MWWYNNVWGIQLSSQEEVDHMFVWIVFFYNFKTLFKSPILEYLKHSLKWFLRSRQSIQISCIWSVRNILLNDLLRKKRVVIGKWFLRSRHLIRISYIWSVRNILLNDLLQKIRVVIGKWFLRSRHLIQISYIWSVRNILLNDLLRKKRVVIGKWFLHVIPQQLPQISK